MNVSSELPKKALMPPDILARKGELPIVCLTAYTTPIASLVDRHCDVVSKSCLPKLPWYRRSSWSSRR